jgi:hypothetical protein
MMDLLRFLLKTGGRGELREELYRISREASSAIVFFDIW